MTKAEVLKLIFTVKAAYPVYYRNVSDREFEAMGDLWNAVLADYTYEQAFIAITVYLRQGNKEILQSPGQIVDQIEKLNEASKPDYETLAVEAWEKYIRPAIREGSVHSVEDFEKLPQMLKEVIRGPQYFRELSQMPSATIDSVERSNFINRMFPTAVKRAKEDSRMPDAVRMMIQAKKDQAELEFKEKLAGIELKDDTEKISARDDRVSDPDRVRELYKEWKMKKDREAALDLIEDDAGKKEIG